MLRRGETAKGKKEHRAVGITRPLANLGLFGVVCCTFPY